MDSKTKSKKELFDLTLQFQKAKLMQVVSDQEKNTEHNCGLIKDIRADSIDSTSSDQSSNGWLGDTEDALRDGWWNRLN